MTKAVLEQIERELADLDVKAMAFDHKEAQQCKLALLRIAEKAADLCGCIMIEVARDDQEPKGWRIDVDAMAREKAREAKLRATGALHNVSVKFKRVKS